MSGKYPRVQFNKVSGKIQPVVLVVEETDSGEETLTWYSIADLRKEFKRQKKLEA